VRNGMQGTGMRAVGVACVIVAGFGTGASQAQEAMIPGGMDSFRLNLGGILTNNNTNLRLDGNQGRGTDVDLEATTGLEKSRSSYLVSGVWRFASNHRITFDAFQIDRDRTKAIDRTITIGDTVIPISTSLKSESRTQFIITNYQYSVVKNEAMELAAVIGLYGANFKYKFTAVTPLVDTNASTNAPLPLIGASLDMFLSPRWSATVFGEGLKFKVGDVDGSMYYVGASTEYMFTRNWGVGLGYRIADLKADVSKNDFRGHVGWRTDGYIAYLQARF
jgi:hypothetical protein